MNKKFISYYDLLTIIKDMQGVSNKSNYPKLYWHNNIREKVLYIPTFDNVNNELEGYHLEQRHLENEDIRYWLSECMLESSMFDKCLEIKKKLNRNELLQENKQLKERIDKAIEYIKNELYILGIRDNRKQQEELLEILRGENNE